jgi:3-phenylpropionate/trans-cinnamate dioxygenase ferredoxin reductase subunit
MEKVVIIGAGHGGVQVASSLREEGFAGEIHLFSDETEMPYQKPPLSKGYLQGKQSAEAILFRSHAFYDNNHIQLHLGRRVLSVSPKLNEIETDTGGKITYTKLVFATGASNRKLQFEGKTPANILYLRNFSDAKDIESKLAEAQNVVVIGGGFIGLEIAALATEKGKNVTVIEAQSRLMERMLPSIISDIFYKKHLEKGVKVLLNSFTEKVTETNEVTLSNGTILKADLIIAGIGVIPNTALAEQAGIICQNGIAVNEFQETSVPNIFAIGDCANHYNYYSQSQTRLESVQNAVDQGKIVAMNILGKKTAYKAVPWFWTFQYELKLQMAGISNNYDSFFIRGEQTSGKFSVYYFKNNKLIGVDSLNKPADHLNARKLLEAEVAISQEQIEDLDFNLNQLF